MALREAWRNCRRFRSPRRSADTASRGAAFVQIEGEQSGNNE